MGIGTFGAFTQARLAIYAAQTGISVTGNNISNINTPGYTRQRLNQVSLYAAGSDRYYAEGDIRTGQGALVKSLSQIRSPYLDIRYRTLNAQTGYADGRLETLNEIQQILDEVGAGDETKGEGGHGILGQEIKKLGEAFKNLVDQTGHQEYDNTVRTISENLVGLLNKYANKLEEVRENTVSKLEQNLEEVNGYLTTIRSLNEEIRKSEIHGDPALELRDERNRQIDELSELIDINVTYGEEVISGGLTVEKLTIALDDANTDGTVTTDESLLVDGVFSAQISFGTPVTNPYYGVKLDEPSDALTALNKLLDDMEKANQIADLVERNKLLQAFSSSPYLSQEKDAGGKVVKETPVADIRDASVLTDDGNPLYRMMISELKNKAGELNVTAHAYAEETVEWDDIKDLHLDFNRVNQAITEDDGPARGDKTITIYSRTLKPNAPKPPKDTDYTYTKQVYEHLITKPVALDDNDLTGKIQAHREMLTEQGEFTDQDVIKNVDENAGGKRGIPYYQRTLDLLANQFAKVMNEANQGFLTDPEGNYITKGKNDAGEEIGVPVTIKVNGKDEKISSSWEKNSADVRNEILKALGLDDTTMKEKKLTGKNVLDAYLKGQTWKDGKFEPENWQNAGNAKGIFRGGVLFSNNPGNDDPSGITAANISISHTWETTHLLVCDYTCPVGKTEPASGASENIRHFEYLVTNQKFDFIPTDLDGYENTSGAPMFNGTFFEMWNNVGTTLGADQKKTSVDLDSHYTNLLSVDTERDSVSSVDFNDEAMNLMMYSKSYNAACRLMTTIDSVLDKLINNTGMTT